MIAGVCAGIARYLNTDPVIVRLVFVLLAFSGPGIFFYPLLWIVMPQEPAAPSPAQAPGQVFVSTGATQRLRIDPSTGVNGEPELEIPVNNVGRQSGSAPASQSGGKLMGYILLGLGAFIVLQMVWPGISSLIFPAILIGAGVWLLRRA
jgi:phage shock protein PspC (stress-responsive transcriptional regulator)